MGKPGDETDEEERKNAKIKREVPSGGKVGHLESGLPLRFNPRSSGQITAAFYL
ncbi:hypothetical protein DSLASN_28760 [Desulfoluna limicola]|uniref:Uncharacterized protein n=1 Tax=Desulfoluna limicola TaxID=2810562 RepID=A0ABM7PJ75_9BACT|nr:hypothetical protein DSLASN_28760 [Desulfoluna limicola]